MRIELEGPSEVGEGMKVRFRLRGLVDAIEADAVVRWQDRLDPRVCGIQFTTGLRAKEVWAINRLG
jgi:hypothetical protein